MSFAEAPMLMGIMQFIIHGIITNIKMRSFYNPGLCAVVFLHIPVGVCYLHYITLNQLTTGATWVGAIVYTIIATGFVLGYLTYVAFPDRNSKWRFHSAELERFHLEEKLVQKNIVVHQHTEFGPLTMIEKIKGKIS